MKKRKKIFLFENDHDADVYARQWYPVGYYAEVKGTRPPISLKIIGHSTELSPCGLLGIVLKCGLENACVNGSIKVYPEGLRGPWASDSSE